MNRDRGFKRLLLVLTLAWLVVGLSLTALDAERARLWVIGEGQKQVCLDRIGRPLSEDSFQKRLDACRELAEANPFPPRLGAVLNTLGALHHIGIAPETVEDFLSDLIYHPRRSTWLVGVSVVLVGAAAPWGVFYVLRWVVKGFAG